MMRFSKFIVLSVLLTTVLSSCFKQSDFDEVPRIAFNSLTFKPVNGNIPDSLILTIDFQDGDGNIGLIEDFDIIPLYHSFDFIIDANNRFVTLNGEGFVPPFDRTFLSFDERGQLLLKYSEFSEVDNRPSEFDCQSYVVDSIEAVWGAPFPPYQLPIFVANCINATAQNPCVEKDTLFDINGTQIFQTKLDTFFIAKNEGNKNIFVDFFRKRSGEYEFIDWTRAFSDIGCGPDFNARFPIFADDRIGKSLEGTIRYGMQSEGFELVLRTDTFKVQVRILDRSLNVSNTVESPDMTLNQIRG